MHFTSATPAPGTWTSTGDLAVLKGRSGTAAQTTRITYGQSAHSKGKLGSREPAAALSIDRHGGDGRDASIGVESQSRTPAGGRSRAHRKTAVGGRWLAARRGARVDDSTPRRFAVA
jgi:hypothetical protein